ncbi:response regulator transcription factor [Domibacillus sp. A3M-37]|uniref:response regulator transcription factor n=1 Tax=Domibacillus sp. A3M-37 TaxID=2962037 RepID=UPI0020B73790|nr:response regulator transcription factor [Domibacillus sp. A3M-37]MCP3761613.1 response regulator transcription factor [Domibacillus sp. A3M-37]
MSHLLIVDDEQDMVDLVTMYMENAGYTVSSALNGDEAEEKLKESHPDLIILDLMMPGRDGFAICESIRSYSDVPIIFLTARGEEWDKVRAFSIGGDDYIVKPFSPGEMTARIQAVLRRFGKVDEKRETIRYQTLSIDVHSRAVRVDGAAIQLTMKEFDLLVLLAKKRGRIFSREELLETVWGTEYSGGTRTVDTHIKTLRMKLKNEGASIETVWGIGYKFVDGAV